MLPSSYRKENVLLKRKKKKKTLRVKSRKRRDELETRWCRHLFCFLLTLSSLVCLLLHVNRKWFLFSIAIKSIDTTRRSLLFNKFSRVERKEAEKPSNFVCRRCVLLPEKNFRLSFSSGTHTHSLVRSAESDSSSANLGRCFIRILSFFRWQATPELVSCFFFLFLGFSMPFPLTAVNILHFDEWFHVFPSIEDKTLPSLHCLINKHDECRKNNRQRAWIDTIQI